MRIRAIKGSGEASSNYVSRPTSEPRKPSQRSQAIWASRASKEVIQLLSQPASNQPTNQPTKQPTSQPTKQLTNQPPTNKPIRRPTNHGADLANYSQNKSLRPPLPRKPGREDEEEEPKSCFKFAKNFICISWHSQIFQTVYLSLQLQNHMGFRFGSSWGVVEQISKSHW